MGADVAFNGSSATLVLGRERRIATRPVGCLNGYGVQLVSLVTLDRSHRRERPGDRGSFRSLGTGAFITSDAHARSRHGHSTAVDSFSASSQLYASTLTASMPVPS